jgi:hypothetical protein
MTRIHTIATAAALAFSFVAGAAHAQDAIPATWANEQVKPFVSTVSRAQVLAELQAARQSGEVNAFDTLAYHQNKAGVANVSTALAQVREGAANVATTTGAKTDGGLTRAQVRAELEAARRSGELNPFDNLSDLQPVAHRAVVAPAAVASR